MRVRVLVLAAALGCGGGPHASTFAWTPRVEPKLGVATEIEKTWRADVVDDSLLLMPTAPGDDFAILVVRGDAPAEDAALLARIGTLDKVQIGKLAPSAAIQDHVADLRGGTAVTHTTNEAVVIRVARVRGQAVVVEAVISAHSAERGTAAFEHVVSKLVLSAPAADASRPQIPDWLKPRVEPAHEDGSDDQTDDGTTDGTSNGSDSNGGGDEEQDNDGN